MPQQQQAWPTGVKVIDEGFSPEKQKADTTPPPVADPISSKFSTEPGAVLSFLNAVDAPFSLFDTHGSLKMPDIAANAANAGELLKGMLLLSKDTYQPGEINPAQEVANIGHAIKDTFSKITKGSTEEKATGLGQLVATVLQTWLTGKAMGKMFPEGMAPKSPKIPAAPPAARMMGPKPVQPMPAHRYGPKSNPEWQGPIEPQGPPTPPPEWQGPHTSQGPQMPKFVVVRGLNPKNPGQFGRVASSSIDPDILRQHLNSKMALEGEAVLKSSKAPKPPTKTTPKSKK